ncbi:hypothetical protein ACQKGO_09855 [Corallococcus interemptor]|uniref:hypothetical protein n=1 Tax=Corallococcus interemptor TaxID=2316720 RepID=UPI003D05A9B7
MAPVSTGAFFAAGIFDGWAPGFAIGAFAADFAAGVFEAWAVFAAGPFDAWAPGFVTEALGACAAFEPEAFGAGAAFALDAFATGFAFPAGAFFAAVFTALAACFSFAATVFRACATGFEAPAFFAGAEALPPAGRPPGFVAALPAALRDLDVSEGAEGRVGRRWAIKSSSEDPSGRRRRPSSPDG